VRTTRVERRMERCERTDGGFGFGFGGGGRVRVRVERRGDRVVSCVR